VDGQEVRFRVPVEAEDISLLQNVQTRSGAHSASYTMATMAASSGVKRPGRDAYHSFPFSAQINIDGAVPLLPHTSSWPGVQLNKPRDN
jgi:hypothetical protein